MRRRPDGPVWVRDAWPRVTWQADGVVVTVVGDAPDAQIAVASRALPGAREPGRGMVSATVLTLRRGLASVLDWVRGRE